MLNYEKEWRNNLSVGDEVFISQSYGAAPLIAKVSRLTPTRIMAQTDASTYEYQFHKSTGFTVGKDSYNRQYLIMPNQNIRERVELANLKRIAMKLRDRLSIPEDKEELKSFIEALSKFVKK